MIKVTSTLLYQKDHPKVDVGTFNTFGEAHNAATRHIQEHTQNPQPRHVFNTVRTGSALTVIDTDTGKRFRNTRTHMIVSLQEEPGPSDRATSMVSVV